MANVTVTFNRTSGNVTIDTNNDNTFAATGETLTFTTINWSTAQPVRVQSETDSNLADDSAGINHVASNAGADASGYAGISKALPVTETDTSTPTIKLTHATTGNAITELTVN